jgi:hypothetical protein
MVAWNDNEYYAHPFNGSKCILRHTTIDAADKETIEAWNTRKPMDDIVKQLEEKSFKDYYYNESVYETKYLIWKDKAIEIVRKGGVK